MGFTREQLEFNIVDKRSITQTITLTKKTPKHFNTSLSSLLLLPLLVLLEEAAELRSAAAVM